MFSSQEYIDNKTGRDDLNRFQYLQTLVTEFQDTSSDGIFNKYLNKMSLQNSILQYSPCNTFNAFSNIWIYKILAQHSTYFGTIYRGGNCIHPGGEAVHCGGDAIYCVDDAIQCGGDAIH